MRADLAGVAAGCGFSDEVSRDFACSKVDGSGDWRGSLVRNSPFIAVREAVERVRAALSRNREGAQDLSHQSKQPLLLALLLIGVPEIYRVSLPPRIHLS